MYQFDDWRLKKYFHIIYMLYYNLSNFFKTCHWFIIYLGRLWLLHMVFSWSDPKKASKQKMCTVQNSHLLSPHLKLFSIDPSRKFCNFDKSISLPLNDIYKKKIDNKNNKMFFSQMIFLKFISQQHQPQLHSRHCIQEPSLFWIRIYFFTSPN